MKRIPKNPDAKMFKEMTHINFSAAVIAVMDSTAVTLCMENNLPILVLNLWDLMHSWLR